MYNGYGGGYGGQAGGGQEMMIVMICCVCCLCIACVAGGYFTNMFCGMGSGFGRSCTPTPAPLPPPDPDYTGEPTEDTTSAAANMCSPAYGFTARAKNDPRPQLRPEYCMGAGRQPGRDCYFWEVQSDPATGRARWIRKADPEDPKADMKYGGDCAAAVKCPSFIDPASLDRYSELEPGQLLKQCTAISATAVNKDDAIRVLTREARAVNANWSGTGAWTDANSKLWYDRVTRFVGQKDLAAYFSNAGRAAKSVMAKMKVTSMRKSTFATVLEAAVRSPDNRADWIIDMTNAFLHRQPESPGPRMEASYVGYLRAQLPRPPLQTWATLIDNPKFIR